MKYGTPTSPRWAFWSYCDIPSTVDRSLVYLRRLRVVQTPWFGVYVHWINEPDADRDYHNHPWVFWSWIVRGGYAEDILDTDSGLESVRVHSRGSVHKTSLSVAHKITEVLPRTVTVVLVGPRSREWGFWTDAGFVPWNRYTRVQ